MALPTGSGTETLHAHHFEDVDATQTLILGVQHHVYTVLSAIFYCNVLNAVTDFGTINLIGHEGQVDNLPEVWELPDLIFKWVKPMSGTTNSVSMVTK